MSPSGKNFSSYFKGALFAGKLAFVANIITWLIIYFQIKPGSETIPLHYNIFYGTDLADKGYYIYFIPLIGLAILCVNYFFYKYSLGKDEFAGKILISVSLLVQLIILIAVLFLKSIILI